MARSHARLQFGMWRKPGHRDVPKDARLLYVTILCDETLNQAGIVRLALPMWAEDAGMTENEARAALDALIAHRFVIVDSYELMVRSFIRNDGVADQPNVLRNALTVAMNTRSPVIRRALADELRKLPPAPPPRPNKNGKGMYIYPDPHEAAEVLDPHPQPPNGHYVPPAPPAPAQPVAPVVEGLWEPTPNPSRNPSRNPSGTLPANPSREPFPEPHGEGEGVGELTEQLVTTQVESVARTRARDTRRRSTPTALNATARDVGAVRLVEDFAQRYPSPPLPASEKTRLGVEVSSLRKQGWGDDDLSEALDYWRTKDRVGARAFQSVAYEWAKRRDAPPRERQSITSTAVASVSTARAEWEARQQARQAAQPANQPQLPPNVTPHPAIRASGA